MDDNGRATETQIDMPTSTAMTKNVKSPTIEVTRLGVVFSKESITSIAMKEDAIDAIVMKGIKDTR